MVVAGYLGIPTAGREVDEIALDVAEKALEQFGQAHGEIVYDAARHAQAAGAVAQARLTPRAIDREIAEVMHRTHEGVDLDAENILKAALRCSLADGWGGAMLCTDISDILFGTPSPLASEVNLGVLKDDQVNVIVHGHEPTLSAMIVEAARDPELSPRPRPRAPRASTSPASAAPATRSSCATASRRRATSSTRSWPC